VAVEQDAEETSRDDDFLYYLHRGSELLRDKKPEEARGSLERAFQISPDNPKAQNLLGLAYFKLGLLEAAKSIYDRLVEDYPAEPPLYVNLGLVLLRQGRLNEAERALKKAIAIAPEHARAHCYLGLVLYRRGDLALAREHFVKGQADELTKKVEAKLSLGTASRPSQGELLRAVAENGFRDIETSQFPFKPLDMSRDERVVRDEEAWETWVPHDRRETPLLLGLETGSLLPVWNLTPLPAIGSALGDDELSAVDPLRDTTPVAVAPWQEPTPQLATLAQKNGAPKMRGQDRLLARGGSVLPSRDPMNGHKDGSWDAVREKLAFPAFPPLVEELPVPPPVDEPVQEDSDLPGEVMYGDSGTSTGDIIAAHKTHAALGFHAGPGARARLSIESRAYLKRSTIVAASGKLSMTPAMSQLQGNTTASPFGDAADPMCLLEGRAIVLIRTKHTAVALRGVRDLHVKAPALVGFDDGFTFDNGRILGLDMVTLRGAGSLLLDTEEAPMVIPVDPETPVHAAVDAILAWSDGVRPSPLEGANSDARLFRLRGKGYVLVAFPPEDR
jgi:hypothetical protein